MKHQKWLSVLFVVLALVIVSVLALPAQAAEESDLTFTLNADGQSYSVTACNTSTSGELVIPSTHEGKPVTAIGDKAFYECYGLSYISIPDTVTSIGMEAFAFCDLPELTIPSSVVSIGSSAFYGNNNLIYKNFGNAKYLGNSENPYLVLVQAEDTEITECRILPETKIILGNAFYGCTNLSAITYCGTQEQWDAITVGDNNTPLTDAALRFHNYEDEICTVCQRSGTCGENLTWTLDAAGTLTISGTGAMENYYSANEPWYHLYNSIKRLVIEDGVTTIGEYAFDGCSGMQSLTIGSGVRTIMAYAFNGCYGLQSITIPEGVTTIAEHAFGECYLEEINFNATALNDLEYMDYIFSCGTLNIGANVTRIPNFLLQDSYYLSAVNFAEGSVCEYIGHNAFYDCGGLEHITIPDSVKTIEAYAFAYCDSLQKVTIGDGVNVIGIRAFESCNSLRSVTIGKNVKYIGYYAFNECIVLEEINLNATAADDLESDTYSVFYNAGRNNTGITVNIGANVTRIPQFLFGCDSDYYAPKIIKVVFAEGSACTSIGQQAFYNCAYLQSVTIGEKVTDIGESAFAGCSALQGIWVDENNLAYSNDAYGVLFNKNKTKLIQAPNSITGSYEIPGSVTCIADSAFAGCAKLKGVTVPSTVTEIAYYTFGRCTALENVSLPNTLRTLGDAAFYRCESLQSIDVPDGVKAIGNSAFSTCTGLQSIAVPDSVTDLGDYVFSKCYGLESITIGEGVPAVGERAFYMCESLQELVLGSNVASIGSDAFYGNISLEEITIPGKVLEISSYMFSGCTSLRSVTLLNGVANIYSAAFSGCTALQSISIPDSVTFISSGAFSDCTALCFNTYEGAKYLGNNSNPYLYLYQAVSTSITECSTHKDTKLIRAKAFAGCTQLRSLIIQEGITSIGNIFAGCVGLEHISIPDSLTGLYNYMFADCVNLVFNEYEGAKYLGNSSNPYVYLHQAVSTDITECIIHADTKLIADEAFSGCTKLETIELPGGVTYIDYRTFYNCSSLQTIIIPDGVTSIGSEAFYSCTGLQSITFSESVEAIDNDAFYNCTNLVAAFYSGTATQKAKIQIGAGNASLNGAWHYEVQKIQFCGQDCYYCGHCRKSMTLLGEDVKATVTFLDEDGTELYTQHCYFGEMAVNSVYPTKEPDDAHNYVFAGWDRPVVQCTGNTTYTAKFVPVCIHHTVVFKDWDGSVISSITYHYGDTVIVPSAPLRPSDNQYTYTFDGWDKEIAACTADATYTATYLATDINYTVAFKNWNGAVLDYGTYHYGDALNFPTVPTRPNDNKYTYTFAGWDSTDTSCSGNAVYTAVFKQTEINYTVVFKDWNGNVLSTKIYHYGDKVSAPTAPTRAADHMYTYTFDGWDKAVVDCSGNAIYTALYKFTYRSYTVTFKNWDSTILSTKTYNYGDTILAPSVPKRPNNSKYSYTYVGWDGVVGKCTGNATYTAVFTAQSLVPTTVTSTKHTVSGGTISKIGVGTTVSTLLGNLNENSYAKVYQGNNVVSGSTLIGTGMEVKILDGNTVKASATVVVTGDTNGDGKLTITDMLAAKAHVLKKNTLQGASSQAADTNGDGGISITDFIQMKAHILGKSTVEPKSAVTTVSVGVARSGAVACAAKVQPAPQAEAETVSVPASVDVILPDKKLFALV